MSQATIEAGIVSTITQHADFSTTNVKLYDWRVMAKGQARFVVISYNTHRREEITLTMERRTWTYNVDVLVPWHGEMSELDTRVGTETQKIIDTLAQYPRLNGVSGIQKTVMSASNTPDLITAKKGNFKGRRHMLDVLEIYDPSRAE